MREILFRTNRFDALEALKSVKSHLSRTRKISYCESKFNAGAGEWNCRRKLAMGCFYIYGKIMY